MKIKKQSYTIIAGCSRFGASISTYLSLKGENVVVIDLEKKSFKKLSNNFSGFTIEGDATDINTLLEAGIKKSTTIVAATNDDDVNIMISQISRKIFNVESIISRLYDEDKDVVYKGLDIKIIRPLSLVMKEFEILNSMDDRTEKDNGKMNLFKALEFNNKVGGL